MEQRTSAVSKGSKRIIEGACIIGSIARPAGGIQFRPLHELAMESPAGYAHELCGFGPVSLSLKEGFA